MPNWDVIRTVIWFGFALALPSNRCAERCSRVNIPGSYSLVNCSGLGLREVPNIQEFFEISDDTEEIDLSRNEITQVSFPQKSFRRINLSYNDIAIMKNIEINAMPVLIELDLSHNKKLEKMSRDASSGSLEVLTVSGCSINEIEDGLLENYPSLTRLDISYNSLTELATLFPSRHASLVEPNEWDNTRHKLTHLNLSHNEIYAIQGKDLIGTRINILDVSNNNVDHLRFTAYLQHLIELHMSNNNLKNFDGIALPNAVVFDASKNQLRDIQVDFTKRAPKLKTLNLSHNLIRRIPKISSSSISDLDLSYCSISVVEPEAFSTLVDLQRLNLIGNELTSFRHELLHHANNLESLLLAENPWKCDCESEEFRGLYNFMLLERSYSDGEDLHCDNETVFPWSDACREKTYNDDLYLSSQTAFYSFLYLFAALFAILLVIGCYKCIRNMKQSNEMSFENEVSVVNDTEYVAPREYPDIPYIDDPVPSMSARRSTPPPNYETAVILPALTEEQKEMALSTLSLHKI